ncbi:hypothetical protein [Occallatibacter savannae]|uniref:hypothetical protein n=1 Tax=Occallatibacter savannae TaxID=1002691 RepID=UPI000D68E936|nr:hypothetical protein [Occallatibacter savannae]
MIDPLGPDPNDPATRPAKPKDVISDFEAPGAAARLRPKIRHANYDSPEALVRPEDAEHQKPVTEPKPPPIPAPQPKPAIPAEPAARTAAPPVVIPESKKISMPKTAANAAIPLAETPRVADPVTSALAHPVPPKPGKLERAVGLAKTMLPIVGNLLPLLEGNVAGAAANLIANRHGGQQVDLKPMEEAIAKLQSDQRALTFHTGEQKRAIRRIEDEFATLQESVQKHAADQAELAEQLVKLAKRTSSFMRLVTILLIVSILFSALLVVRIAYLMHS